MVERVCLHVSLSERGATQIKVHSVSWKVQTENPDTHVFTDCGTFSYKSITAWREKKPSYKGNLNRVCRGTLLRITQSTKTLVVLYGAPSCEHKAIRATQF